jgi:hypothetical protein
MTVLNSDTAFYAALKFLPEGTKMTVYTRTPGKARTNVVAELRKELGNGWNDWEVLKRPASADASLLPEDQPAIISTKTLAGALEVNSYLWASVDD